MGIGSDKVKRMYKNNSKLWQQIMSKGHDEDLITRLLFFDLSDIDD